MTALARLPTGFASQAGGLLLLLLLPGCASQQVPPAEPLLTNSNEAAAACVTALTDTSADALTDKLPNELVSGSASEAPPRPSMLDAGSIRIVNWNIRKGSEARWAADLQALEPEPDILLLQEASPDLEAITRLSALHHLAFAEGYSNSKRRTGVMTLSRAKPLGECTLTSREPWLGTPKAMLVTNYAISGTDTSLLVINIHGVNFSINARELAAQINSAELIINAHSGPVLFSGDFNTWRSGRIQLLDDAAARLGLTSLVYTSDHRKRVMGFPLDHVYTRGLVTIAAASPKLTSSDHNPMVAELRLETVIRGSLTP
jgi:endonuclease/exonuclease/phosphatase (EEP) superfamily protein YafD